MAKVIIGIHGLKNKPDPDILKDWWIRSIRGGMNFCGAPDITFKFELIYWSDLLYSEPLDPRIDNPDDPRALMQRWASIHQGQQTKRSVFKRKLLTALEVCSDFLLKERTIFKEVQKASDKLIHKRFQDLDAYFSEQTGLGEAKERPVREVILERLDSVLQKYKDDEICIIAHSMGSIIAYDYLMNGKFPVPVQILLTLGSPLGQPPVMAKLANLEKPLFAKISTPEGVKRWVNHADIDDWVALDFDLKDDFLPNSTGVCPEDVQVNNGYTYNGVKNPHKIYGYLQTPECAALISSFLIKGKSRHALCLARLLRWIEKLFYRAPYNVNRPSPFAAGTQKEESVRAKFQE